MLLLLKGKYMYMELALYKIVHFVVYLLKRSFQLRIFSFF